MSSTVQQGRFSSTGVGSGHAFQTLSAQEVACIFEARGKKGEMKTVECVVEGLHDGVHVVGGTAASGRLMGQHARPQPPCSLLQLLP